MLSCRPVMPRGRGWWPCTGWGARGKRAWRWSTRTATWPTSGWRGSSRPRTRLLCWRSSAGWRPSWAPGSCWMPGTRWRRCTRCWPRSRQAGCWCSTTPPARRRYSGFCHRRGRGRVLITSQSAVWPPGQAVPVPVLDTEVAAVFLVNRTGDPDGQAAAALAAELGGLPLALEQAAAYIHTTGTTLARYLRLFQDRRADLLARGETPGHPADVATTLGLAVSRLEAETSSATALLRL